MNLHIYILQHFAQDQNSTNPLQNTFMVKHKYVFTYLCLTICFIIETFIKKINSNKLPKKFCKDFIGFGGTSLSCGVTNLVIWIDYGNIEIKLFGLLSKYVFFHAFSGKKRATHQPSKIDFLFYNGWTG